MIMDRNKSIDLIRGIAIIMVFIVHYGQSFGTPEITEFGQMGCQLFFLVSGYVCCYSYKKCKNAFEFYLRRFQQLFCVLL